jgi:3-hydroxyisobutyrate dehydrogenase-like beta-hydroxyacid dehydrogenase
MGESNCGATRYDVAVLGCGLMGAALARTFAKGGYTVAAWNRTPERAEALAGDGITPIRPVEDAVNSSRLIVACMTTYEVTLAALEPVARWHGATLVNVASGAPQEVEVLARWAAERGAQYLDGSIIGYPRDIGTTDAVILYSGSLAGWTEHSAPLMKLAPASAFVSERVIDSSVLNVGLVGGFAVAALSAYVEAATYVLSQGVAAELLQAITHGAFDSLRKETEEAAAAIASGEFKTDQVTIDTYAEAGGAALAVMQGSGQRARLLEAATENLAAAAEAGLGSLGFSAQTKIAAATAGAES